MLTLPHYLLFLLDLVHAAVGLGNVFVQRDRQIIYQHLAYGKAQVERVFFVLSNFFTA